MEMKHTGDYELDEINILEQECADLEEENKRLEEENKKLKEKVSELEDISKDYDILSHDFITATGEIEFWKDEVERLKQNIMQDELEIIPKLEKENKKLKEDVDFYYKSAKQFREQVEKWEKDFVE